MCTRIIPEHARWIKQQWTKTLQKMSNILWIVNVSGNTSLIYSKTSLIKKISLGPVGAQCIMVLVVIGMTLLPYKCLDWSYNSSPIVFTTYYRWKISCISFKVQLFLVVIIILFLSFDSNEEVVTRNTILELQGRNLRFNNHYYHSNATSVGYCRHSSWSHGK